MKISIKDVHTQLSLLAETLGYPTSKDEAISRGVRHYVLLQKTFTGYSIGLCNTDSGSVSKLANLPCFSQTKTVWFHQLCEINNLLSAISNDGLPVQPLRRLTKLDTITVIGRRCFLSGNTYHSCTVYVNGTFIGENKYAYGYDDAYKETAYKLLADAGYLPKNPEWSGITNNTNANVIFTVSDVKNKKDL